MRISALERELAKYGHAPSRTACAQAFLRWGEKLGYPTLFVLRGREQPLTLQQGREAWQQFIASLTNELLWAAVEGVEEWYYHCRPNELPRRHWLTGHTRMCDAQAKMRIAEVELARYRGILEPSTRAKLEQAFMAAGAVIDYHQLTNVRAGLDGYQRFMDYSPNENLVKATVEATAYAEALAIQLSRRGSGARPVEQS